MIGWAVDEDSENAESIKTSNAQYDAMLKCRSEAPEKYVNGETQTINPLRKQQETQSASLSNVDKGTQVTFTRRRHILQSCQGDGMGHIPKLGARDARQCRAGESLGRSYGSVQAKYPRHRR